MAKRVNPKRKSTAQHPTTIAYLKPSLDQSRTSALGRAPMNVHRPQHFIGIQFHGIAPKLRLEDMVHMLAVTFFTGLDKQPLPYRSKKFRRRAPPFLAPVCAARDGQLGRSSKPLQARRAKPHALISVRHAASLQGWYRNVPETPRVLGRRTVMGELPIMAGGQSRGKVPDPDRAVRRVSRRFVGVDSFGWIVDQLAVRFQHQRKKRLLPV